MTFRIKRMVSRTMRKTDGWRIATNLEKTTPLPHNHQTVLGGLRNDQCPSPKLETGGRYFAIRKNHVKPPKGLPATSFLAS